MQGVNRVQSTECCEAIYLYCLLHVIFHHEERWFTRKKNSRRGWHKNASLYPLVQADRGCPRLRWAVVDHGSQLASSILDANWRQAGGPCVKYRSCLTHAFLYRLVKKQHVHIVGTSKSHVCLCPFSKKNHLACCLVSGVMDGRDKTGNCARLC